MRGPTIAWGEVTIDCLETERVATFWGALLDAPSQGHGQAGWFRVGPLVSGGPLINFQPVPERKAGKTRIHLDVWTDDLDAAVALVKDLGGRRLSEMGEDPEGVGFVMADPDARLPRAAVTAVTHSEPAHCAGEASANNGVLEVP